jgi:hypothetical protein
MVKAANNDKYIPGVCNIGPAERAKRRQSGYVGLLAAVILLVTLVAIGAARGWRLFLIIPLFAAALGFLQDWFHFCIGFGLKGLYNVINSVGTTDSVSQAEYRAKDKKKAISILWTSLAISVIIAVVLVLI